MALYYWSPGYFIHQPNPTERGEVREKKFISTSTFTAAVSHLTQRYGSTEMLNHKKDLSPGHVALAVKDRYLSVGPDIEPISSEGVSLISTHKLLVSPNLRRDIFGLERIPLAVDFHSLNAKEVEYAILELLQKSPDALYSMLGGRLVMSEGYSCATAAFQCLKKGGLLDLINFLPLKIFSEKSVLTPASLKDYSSIARTCEHERYPAARDLSKEFQNIFESEMRKISIELQKALNVSVSEKNHDDFSRKF